MAKKDAGTKVGGVVPQKLGTLKSVFGGYLSTLSSSEIDDLRKEWNLKVPRELYGIHKQISSATNTLRAKVRKSIRDSSPSSKKQSQPEKLTQAESEMLHRICPNEDDLLDLLDRQAGLCFYTGISLIGQEMQLDHVHPRSRGGSDSIENLAWCLKAVNMSKWAMDPHEYIELCRQVANNYPVVCEF